MPETSAAPNEPNRPSEPTPPRLPLPGDEAPHDVTAPMQDNGGTTSDLLGDGPDATRGDASTRALGDARSGMHPSDGIRSPTVDDRSEFSKIEPLKLIGQGGGGTVWLARYLFPKEAHKYLHRAGGSSDGWNRARKRAFDEAKNANRIDHPCVVKVYSVQDDLDRREPFLRMEFVDGRDLDQVLEEDGIFTAERAATLLLPVADALAAAHQLSCAHLDIKPSNILLGNDGAIRLTDFGIAAALDRDSNVKETRGTPYFMSLQRGRSSGPADWKDDLWSFGVTLYFLATGTFPFPFRQLDNDQARQQPPRDPLEWFPHLSPAFWRVVAPMLQRNQSLYDSMHDVHSALEELGQPPADEATRRRRQVRAALAECRFEEARLALRQEQAAGVPSDDEEPAAQLLARIDEFEGQHDELCEEAERHLAEGRPLDALATVRGRELVRFDELLALRRRCSRSARLNAVRRAARTKLADLYDAMLSDSVDHERAARFEYESLENDLCTLSTIVEHAALRREVQVVRRDRRLDPLRWPNEVTKEQLDERLRRVTDERRGYDEKRGKVEQLIERFEFRAAIEALTRLGADQHEELLSRLRDAELQLTRVEVHSPAELERVAADPATCEREVPNLKTAQIAEACRALLRLFPIEPTQESAHAHPSFQRFAELGQLATRASERIGTAVEAREAAAAQWRKPGSEPLELRELVAARRLIDRSDLFDEIGSGAETRRRVQSRCRELERQVQGAAAAYRAGLDAFRHHQWDDAVFHLSRVRGALDPDEIEQVHREGSGTTTDGSSGSLPREPGPLLDMARERAKQFRSDRPQVAQRLDDLQRQLESASPPSSAFDAIPPALVNFEKLYAIAPATERIVLDGRLAGLLAAFVRGARARWGQEPAESLLRDRFLPMMAAPRKRWLRLLADATTEPGKAACRSVDEFLTLLLPSDDRVPEEWQSIPAAIHGLATQLVRPELQPLIAALPPGEDGHHIANRMARKLLLAASEAPREAKQELVEGTAPVFELLKRIAVPEQLAHLEATRREMHGLVHAIETDKLRKRRLRTWRSVALVAALLITTAVVGVVAYQQGTVLGKANALAQSFAALPNTIASPPLDPSVVQAAGSWLQEERITQEQKGARYAWLEAFGGSMGELKDAAAVKDAVADPARCEPLLRRLSMLLSQPTDAGSAAARQAAEALRGQTLGAIESVIQQRLKLLLSEGLEQTATYPPQLTFVEELVALERIAASVPGGKTAAPQADATRSIAQALLGLARLPAAADDSDEYSAVSVSLDAGSTRLKEFATENGSLPAFVPSARRLLASLARARIAARWHQQAENDQLVQWFVPELTNADDADGSVAAESRFADLELLQRLEPLPPLRTAAPFANSPARPVVEAVNLLVRAAER